MSRQCRNLVTEGLVCQYYCYEPTISKSIGVIEGGSAGATVVCDAPCE